jgi:predicted histone-like DNA-binding protein
MSVKFHSVQRGNPSKPGAPKKFYPSLVASGRVNMRYLVKRVADISTVSSADTVAVVEALLTVIPSELGEGYIVDLGDFGSFWLRIQTQGSQSEGDVKASRVTGVLPHFRAGKEFKRALEKIKFQKV